MKSLILSFFFLNVSALVSAQSYSPASIFSHNDYAQESPFNNAYNKRVGYIEVDVFLVNNLLLVGHTRLELKRGRTIQKLYLDPIKSKLEENAGLIYRDTTFKLKLMVDLKTEGVSTLKQLVKILKAYPELTSAKSFEIFVSGNVPDRETWSAFPEWIHFDGRPGTVYTQEQLERITLISTSFQSFAKWNGKGEINNNEKQKLDSLISSVHDMNKKIRFWATPDNENGWQGLIDLKVDVIGTDKVDEVCRFLKISDK